MSSQERENPKFSVIFLALGLALEMGCSPKLIVKSDPVQADVYVVSRGTREKKSLGKTPLELKSDQLQKAVGGTVPPGGFLELLVEKADYKSERYMIPATSFGSLGMTLDVKMKSGEAVDQVAEDVIQRLLNAQKFATLKEYDRAQTELDKILQERPKFSRAMGMRGAIYFVQKRYDESRKWYEEALKSDPKSTTSLEMIARIKAIQEGRTPASVGAGAVSKAKGVK